MTCRLLSLSPFFSSFVLFISVSGKRSGHNHRPEHQSSTWTKQLMSRRKMSARYRVLIIHEDVAGSSLNEISAQPWSPSAPSLQGRTLTRSRKQNKQIKSQVKNHLMRWQSVCACLCASACGRSPNYLAQFATLYNRFKIQITFDAAVIFIVTPSR